MNRRAVLVLVVLLMAGAIWLVVRNPRDTNTGVGPKDDRGGRSEGDTPATFQPPALRGAPEAAETVTGEETTEVEPAEAGASRGGLGFDVLITSEGAGAPPADVYVTTLDFGGKEALETLRTDGAGRARVGRLPAGSYRVIAAAHGCGRARSIVKLPRDSAEPVELRLPLAHDLEIRVIDRDTEEPVRGAAIEVLAYVSLPDFGTSMGLVSHPATLTTDDRGVAMLNGLGGTERLHLKATAAGYPVLSGRTRPSGPGHARVNGDAGEVTIELVASHAIRWPIEAGVFPVPPDGTRCEIRPWTGSGRSDVPADGVVEKGMLVVEGWGGDGAAGYALGPDDSIARFQAQPGEQTGSPITFYPQRKITVRARYEDGEPAPGWAVTAKDQGNNPVQTPDLTDEDGVATIEELYGGKWSLVDVVIHPAGSRYFGGYPVGSVDLQKGDGDLEVSLYRERRIRVYVSVEGKPGFPPEIPNVLVGHRPAKVLQTDEEEASLLVGWRPGRGGRRTSVAVRHYGFLSTTALVEAGEIDEIIEARVDLRKAGALKVKVTLPEDGRHEVVLQAWLPKKEAWDGNTAANAYNFSNGRGADANGVIFFDGLVPGRYRLVDAYSGIATDGFEIPAGEEPVTRTLDLSTSGWTRGKVVAPEGVSFEGIRVGIEGDPPIDLGYGPPRFGNAVNEDGEFWVRVPGNRAVTIRPFHASLVPAETGGRVALTKPREGLALHLVPGSTTTLRFSRRLVPEAVSMIQATRKEVRLYEDEVEGSPVATLGGVLRKDGRTLELGGYAPGTYTVWIDAAPFVPVVMEGVVLGSEAVDLGEVPVDEGATFVLRVLVKEGASAPRYSVSLVHEGEPAYSRSAQLWKDSEARVTGLGKGRFRLHATAVMGGGKYLTEVIEFDGARQVERTIDLR